MLAEQSRHLFAPRIHTLLWNQRECRAHSAKFSMSGEPGTLVLAPFHKFLVPYQDIF